MNKRINTFSTEEAYNIYIASELAQYPNIAYVKENKTVYIKRNIRNYLRFEATTNDVHIGVNDLSMFTDLQYSFDADNFVDFTSDGVDLTMGQTLYLRGNGTTSNYGNRSFTTSDMVECHGNVMSLLSYDFEDLLTCSRNCFVGLFATTLITTAPELPATTLTQFCYRYMFQSCTSLVTAPELPATSLASACYEHMFDGCTSLVNVPALQGTTLTSGCYNYMFYNCTSLKEIYCNIRWYNATTEITNDIANNWLTGVPNETDCIFHKNPEWAGPTTRGINTIPSEWQIVDWVQ